MEFTEVRTADPGNQNNLKASLLVSIPMKHDYDPKGQDYELLLDKSLDEVCIEANQYECNSVVMPLMGYGLRKYKRTQREVAQMIVTALLGTLAKRRE